MSRFRFRSRKGALGLGAAALALLLGFTPAAVGLGGVHLPRFSGIEELPLPGGADLGDHPYEVTAEFRDVLSLVPQSSVKVNDVPVGRVTRIRLAGDGWTARVTMRINGGVRLPARPYARIEQSSLLGEKYVQLLEPPTGKSASGGTGKAAATATPTASATTARASAAALRRGLRIPLERTDRNPEVEEVLGALSLLLNGGGVNQLKTITRELNKALDGNEPEVRSMLRRVDKLVGNLDGHKHDITRALDGVNRLAATLASRKKEIRTVLTGVSPGLTTLKKQRGQLMTMLTSLDTLSGVAVDTVDRSKEDLVADLRALAPVLGRFADAGKDLPDSLQALFTYPFTDEVMRGIKGDYLNIYLDTTAVPGTQLVPPLEKEPFPEEDGGATTPVTAGVGTSSDALPGSAAAAPPVALPSTGGDR